MERCLVTGNSNRFGGGVFIREATLDNCTIVSNRAELQGGALSLEGGLVRNTLLVGNQAGSQGGGVYAGATVLLINLTIAANLSPLGGGVYLTDSAELWNSIVISNLTDNIMNQGPGSTIQFTLSTPAPSGPGNLDLPPFLCDAPDYHLTAASPALNAGSNHPAILGTRDMDGQARLFVEQESTSGLYHVITDRVDLGADEGTVESAGLTASSQGPDLVWNSIPQARHLLQWTTNGPTGGWSAGGEVFTAQQARVELMLTNYHGTHAHYRLLWLK